MQVLSQVDDSDFPEEWYDHTTATHFWVRWRFRVLLAQLATLGLDRHAPLTALDVGCGHGVLQQQLTEATAWRIDGCDLNKPALARNRPARGGVYLYNIFDREAAFRAAYDVIILYDVIEHIEDPLPFLEAALWHLKSGGVVLVNVPALMRLYSRYDVAAGHFRRYSAASLVAELGQAGLAPLDVRYWGLTLIPLLALRRALVAWRTDTDDIIRFGFKPPHPVVGALLGGAGRIERAVLSRPPLGTSVMVAARKPATGEAPS